MTAFKFCPACATPMAAVDEGGASRQRCPACGYTHWNNPTPVLAAIIECSDREGRLLLARNAAWPMKFYGLITGFMEAGETPEDGIRREIGEETGLQVSALSLVGVHDFQRMNQVIITYHAVAQGEIVLNEELVDYKLIAPEAVKCWPAGTGRALAQWLQGRGIEPQWMELPRG
jgi:NADH pyrophosphatase NudC (nudix superfamily)